MTIQIFGITLHIWAIATGIVAAQIILALAYFLVWAGMTVQAASTYSGLLYLQALRKSSNERKQQSTEDFLARLLWDHPEKKRLHDTLHRSGLWLWDLWEKFRDRNEESAEELTIDDPRIGKEAQYKTWATGTIVQIWRFSDGEECIKIKDGSRELEGEGKDFALL